MWCNQAYQLWNVNLYWGNIYVELLSKLSASRNRVRRAGMFLSSGKYAQSQCLMLSTRCYVWFFSLNHNVLSHVSGTIPARWGRLNFFTVKQNTSSSLKRCLLSIIFMCYSFQKVLMHFLTVVQAFVFFFFNQCACSNTWFFLK